jgi:hypothetical protein
VNAAIEFRFRKWDGTPHWVHPSIVLGQDDCGTWIGQLRSMTSSRPGATFNPDPASVTVLPPGSGWVATFFPPATGRIRIYADIVADLDVDAFTAVDMDLDVVLADGVLSIDDEDEFEQHRLSMGYPDNLVERCRADAAHVNAMVRAAEPPFDGRADAWLARLTALPERGTAP